VSTHGFSDGVLAAARKLGEPEQKGSHAWAVASLSSPGRQRFVHTDADHIGEGRVWVSFATCSCPAGKKTDARIVHCSHVFRVLVEIVRKALAREQQEG
jgi:hypothetical protein